MGHAFAFFADTYETERLKTLTVWSQFADADLSFRPEPRARTPLEHFVHQCLSEEAWFKAMLQLEAGLPPLPSPETRQGFLESYAASSGKRLALLREKPAAWFEEEAAFFDVRRSRAWILLRRFTHSAHHRGQLTAYLRILGRDLFSTYGPTADTGGLAANGAGVVYRYETLEELLSAEAEGGQSRALPGPGKKAPTERP